MANDIIKEDAPYADFAERLTKLRKEAGLTREELGKKCGVVGRTIINYENGSRIPFADTAVKMAAVFGITVEDLLGVENPELAMAQAQGLELMRQTKGRKSADRLQTLYQEAAHLAGGDLTDDQLLEFSMEMTKAAQLAQMELTRRFTNKRYQNTVEEKERQTAESVAAIDAAIEELTSGK